MHFHWCQQVQTTAAVFINPQGRSQNYVDSQVFILKQNDCFIVNAVKEVLLLSPVSLWVQQNLEYLGVIGSYVEKHEEKLFWKGKNLYKCFSFYTTACLLTLTCIPSVQETSHIN